MPIFEYRVEIVNILSVNGENNLADTLNRCAKEGWRWRDTQRRTEHNGALVEVLLTFEREVPERASSKKAQA